MDTLVTRKQPFVFTLLDSSLNPLTGHTPLPLYTRHYLYGCHWSAKNGASLSLLSEDGVLRSFNEYASRITVRGETLKLAAAPQQIGNGWYYPLRPIAKRLGLRLITKAGSTEISIAYKRQEITAALKSLKVKSGAGQPQTLSRPLLTVTASGEGVVDLELLWDLLKIPAKFDPKGPTLDLWPLTAEDTP